MKANHNRRTRFCTSGVCCSLQHKDTKNESKSQLADVSHDYTTRCSLQHKDTKNESKSQL